jgi:signal transduction histidine kinase
VFAKFYRGRTAAEQVISGTGLGLAITREIVRSHGGSISLEDVKPHGARFVIALPAMPAGPGDSDEEGP